MEPTESLERKVLRFKLLRMLAAPRPENHSSQDMIDTRRTVMLQLWIEIEEELAGLDESAAEEIRERLRMPKTGRIIPIR